MADETDNTPHRPSLFKRRKEDFTVNGIVAAISLAAGLVIGWIIGESKEKAQTVVAEADYVDEVLDRADRQIQDANAILAGRLRYPRLVTRQQQAMWIAEGIMDDVNSARQFATAYADLLEEKFKPLSEALATKNSKAVADELRKLRESFTGKAEQVRTAKRRLLRGLKMPPITPVALSR